MRRVYIQLEDFVEVYVKAARGLKKIAFTCDKGAHYDITDDIVKVKINGQLVYEKGK
jgi:hypothetical protein